jgi:hypothetical protein
MSQNVRHHAGKNRRIRYQLSPEPTTGVNFGALGCSATGSGAPAGTTFVNKGAHFTNVHVQLIFWGVQWAGTPNPLANQVINAVQNLLAGPYMSCLAQYGVRRGFLTGTTYVTNADPPNPFSYSNVGQFNPDPA